MEILIDLGELKMTNMKIFNMALKLSWLKRLNIQTEGWAEFPIQYEIHNICKYGDQFPKNIY